MTGIVRAAALAGSALLFVAGAARAQTPPSGKTPDANPPPAVEGPTKTPPQNGVIRPPTDVDPGMKQGVPAPSAFPTPIIPPPGTPGGNPTVVPK
ncbi:MAG TPA: hypothetical protein VHS58_21235 [Acetobacteraceae bacterium]|jgi:hypothetical protein|nr:hypothetical protein [Acetobacteraceae bacterium]